MVDNAIKPSQTKHMQKKRRGILSIIWKFNFYDKIKRDFFEDVAVPNPGSSCTTTYLLSHKPSKLHEQNMQGTAGKVQANT